VSSAAMIGLAVYLVVRAIATVRSGTATVEPATA
jgi:hypothetical protein